MQKKLLALSLVLLSIFYCTAQSASSNVISPQGGYAKNNNFSLEWTLGETVAATSSLPGYIYTQGFNQSFFIAGKQSSKAFSEWITVIAAPNPVTANIIVTIESMAPGKYDLQITNATGVKVFQKRSNPGNQKTSIDMRRFTSGAYMLQVFNGDNKLVYTTTIIKL